jgi:hypothetical protein
MKPKQIPGPLRIGHFDELLNMHPSEVKSVRVLSRQEAAEVRAKIGLTDPSYSLMRKSGLYRDPVTGRVKHRSFIQ